MPMNIEDLLERSDNLLTLPEVAMRLHSLLNDDTASIADIAEVVSLDPVLTSKLLKLANSAFYSFASKIDTIPRAINIIGSDAIYSLALANSTLETFNKIPVDVIDLESFWRQSVDCALIAKHLGLSVVGQSTERLFVTGLLHNVGELICVLELPEIAHQIANTDTSSQRVEKQKALLGFTYAELTMEFMKLWRFPAEIYDVVGNIKHPEQSQFVKEATLLALAEKIASTLSELPPADPAELVTEAELSFLRVTLVDINNALDYANLEAINVLSILSPKSMSIY